MTPQAREPLSDHDYDGIRELDNAMPGWWRILFYATILFAVIYMLHYHVLGTGPSSEEQYLLATNPDYSRAGREPQVLYRSPYYTSGVDLTPRLRARLRSHLGPEVSFEALIAAAKLRANSDQLAVLEATFPDIRPEGPLPAAAQPEAPRTPTARPLTLLTDPGSLQRGRKVYLDNCAVCHQNDGGGSIGPNLTDVYWIQGGSFDQIVHTIRAGVPAKGMVPWNKTLSEQEIQNVASYIISLQGSTPAKPKEPQGDPVEPDRIGQ